MTSGILPAVTMSLSAPDFAARSPPLPSPFEYPCISPYSKHEIIMQKLSYELRSKPEWIRKSQDSTIRDRWAAEALEQSAKLEGRWGEPLSTEMVEYVLDELALHAERAKTGIEVSRSALAPRCLMS